MPATVKKDGDTKRRCASTCRASANVIVVLARPVANASPELTAATSTPGSAATAASARSKYLPKLIRFRIER